MWRTTFFGRARRQATRAVPVQFTVPETFALALESPTARGQVKPSDPLFTRVLVPAESSRQGSKTVPCRMIAV